MQLLQHLSGLILPIEDFLYHPIFSQLNLMQ